MIFDIEILYCKGHVEKPDKYETNPVHWMMITCHEKANMARIEVSKTTKPVHLKTKSPCVILIDDIMCHNAVKEVIRKTDARREI